ncbi:MAG: nuclear transport factor 2 family protein [Humibacter sp.]
MAHAARAETRRATIRAFWEHVHAHEFDALEPVLHDEVERIVLWYGGPDTRVGREAYLKKLREIIPSFDEWQVDPGPIHVSDDGVHAFMRCHEVFVRAGRRREIDELFEYTFAPDGRIARINIFFKVDPAMAASVLERYPA